MSTVESFFDVVAPDPSAGVPRDQWDRPMIVPPPGVEPERTSGKFAGMTPYARASSFGNTIEDETNLVKWQRRQIARGIALLYERGKLSAESLPQHPMVEPDDRQGKEAWNTLAERAENEVGSHAKASIGTAIHAGTERVDRGEPIDDLPDVIQDRALAYWRFCKAEGIHPLTIEQFGVEDVHRVAGTWDRTMWYAGRHTIGDVKTGTSMDFAGIGYAVQLGEYAHMMAYDPVTHERTPHDGIDIETAWIIHVDREMGGPVSLHRVDISVGWRYAQLVNSVKEARRIGTKSITPMTDLDLRALHAATSLEQLRAAFAIITRPTEAHRTAAREMAAWLRSR